MPPCRLLVIDQTSVGMGCVYPFAAISAPPGAWATIVPGPAQRTFVAQIAFAPCLAATASEAGIVIGSQPSPGFRTTRSAPSGRKPHTTVSLGRWSAY